MTKCIILGENQEKPKGKPIRFTHYLAADNHKIIIGGKYMPEKYEIIELITRDYSAGLDIMFAHTLDRCNGILFLGKCNDGFVEGGDQ